MPNIFALSAVVFLATARSANLTQSPWLIRLAGYLNPNSSSLGSIALVFFGLNHRLSHSFTPSLTVNPVDSATNLQGATGVAIPGGRPAPPRHLPERVFRTVSPCSAVSPWWPLAFIPSAVEVPTQVAHLSRLGADSPAESWLGRSTPSTRPSRCKPMYLSTYTKGWLRQWTTVFCSLVRWAGKGTQAGEELAADRELLHLSTSELLRPSQGAARFGQKPRRGDGPGRAAVSMPGAGDRSPPTGGPHKPEGGC